MAVRDVLLLPGLMCDRRLWAPQIEALPQRTFVGDTTRADNFPDMARDVLSTAPPRFAMAGLSMGGILAFEIWRQAPERVSHIALLDTNARADPPDRKSRRMQQIEEALSGRLRELAIETQKPVYLAESHRDDDKLLGTIMDMAMDLGPKVFERQSLALKNRVDSVDTLDTIDCPALVLCGREDALCPVSFHELMASRIPGAKLVVVDDCGHLATLEQPDVVTAELEALFER